MVIEAPTDGRPQRKYCTAAHRAIARQHRREGTQRSAAAPPLPAPAAEPPRPGLPLPPLAVQLEANPARRPAEPGRRTRTLAMLGSAGLLVTGTTLSLTDDTPPGTDVGPGSLWQAQDPETEQNWASEARVSMASVERQIQDVEAAEREWNALPAEVRAAGPPDGIRDLARRKALLEQQRGALAQRLASYERLSRAEQALAAVERSVAALDRTLSAAPAPSQSSAAQADEIRRLREQRAAHDRVLAEQRREVERLREGVREAMAAPLPRGDQATRAITAAARDLVRDPARRPRRAPVDSAAPRIPGPHDPALDRVRRLPGEVLAAPPPGPTGTGIPGVTQELTDPGLADAGYPDAGFVATPESSVSGRTVTQIANVAYGRTVPAPPAGGGGRVTSPVQVVPAAPRVDAARPTSPMPDLWASTDTRDTDPLTASRARLAARSADDAISGWSVDENVKNLARLAAANEIRRQSVAESDRYRATGGRGDARRLAETVRAVTEVKARATVDRAIAEKVRRDLKLDRNTAGALVVAGALKQARPADRERLQRLVRDHARHKVAASALKARYKPSKKVERAVREHFRSSARKAVKRAEHKARADLTRKIVRKLLNR